MASRGLIYDPFSDLELAREINSRHMGFVGIQPGDTVLDIGCGPGDSAEWILEHLWDGSEYRGRVVGFDIDPIAIQMAKKRLAGKPVEILDRPIAVQDLGNLGFLEQEFRIAIFANGAHYLRTDEELQGALKAIWRVTGETFALWSAFAKEAYHGNKTGGFSGRWVLKAYQLLEARLGCNLLANRAKSENLQIRGAEEYKNALEAAGFQGVESKITSFPFGPEMYQAISLFPDYVENALPLPAYPKITTEDKSSALFGAVRPVYKAMGVETIDRNYLFVKARRSR